VCVLLDRELSCLDALCCDLFFSYMWFLLDLSFGRTCLRITSAKFVQVVLCTASIVTVSEQMLWCGFFHVFLNMGWLFIVVSMQCI